MAAALNEGNRSLLDAARRRARGDAFDLRLADAAALPFPEAFFDVVLSVNTIYFWPDPDKVLAEMKRILKPGGRLVLGYRSRLLLLWNPVSWFGFRLHGDRQVARLLGEAGFAAEIRKGRTGERLALGTKA